jgi:LAGLIDADG DNA endonuclease family protein
VRIKAFFGVGNIIKDRKTNKVYFVVSSLADLTKIPHFLEYPLLTQKRADFLLFKSIIASYLYS